MLKVLFAVLIALFAMSSPLYGASDDKPFEKTTLPNGIAVLSQDYGEDLAAVCVFVRVGSALEPAGKSGVSSLLARALLSCDPLGKKNPAVLKVEQLGGQTSIDTYCDFTCFTLVVPVDNVGPAMKALGDAITRPDFSDAAFSIERDSMVADNEMREDQPAQRAYRLLLRKTCSSFLDADGENATVKKLTPGDLTAWHKEYYRPENVLVSICGRLTAVRAVRLVDDAFKGWEADGPPRPKPAPAPAGASTSEGLFEEDTAGSGAAAVVGFYAPQIGSPDYPAVRLLEAALTDGMGAGIFKELRDKDGLAYEFGSFMPLSKDWPRVAFYVVTDEGRLGPAVEGIKKSISRVKAGGIGQEELDRARGRVVGEMSIRRETAPQRAWSCGLYEFLGLGADYDTRLARQIEKLGSADLVRAADKYLDKYTAVMLKPLKGRR